MERIDSWDVRILSASTVEINGLFYIELYGRTNDNRSITVRDAIDSIDKYHYFYITSDSKELKRYLETNRDIVKTETKVLSHHGKDIRCTKAYVRDPNAVKRMKHDANIKDEFSGTDISFPMRYIMDNDMEACIRVHGREIEKNNNTSDIVVEMDGFQNISTFNPKLKILSFDIENAIGRTDVSDMEKDDEAEDSFFNKQIYTICAYIQENDTVTNSCKISGNETDILEQFSQFIRDNDPDVISGYNIEGYDIRVLHKRADEYKMTLDWGRDGSALEGYKDPKYNKMIWSVTGRIIVDVWWAVKMDIKPKQESLNAVSKLLLGEGEQKLDVDPRQMDAEWAANPERVMEYCLKDAELSLKILNKIERLRKIMDLATVSKMPISEVNKNRSSLLIDSILIREADKRNVFVPTTNKFDADSDAIEGAYVHEMQAGLYQWVCVLDFKSMYPSMIISKNICFTTLNENGTTISPSGARFLSKDIKEGILPNILKNLMKDRDETKKKMKHAQSNEEHDYFDGLQNAIKVYMNSFYGVFASSFYRFTDKSIGSSITSFCREMTTSIIKDMENNGLHVVASDTDSIFFQSPYSNLEDSKKFGFEMVDKYSGGDVNLEFEKIFHSMFTHGKKKRYVGKIIWPEEKTLIRGYEIRRTDSFDILSETMQDTFDMILDGDIDGAMRLCRNNVRDVSKGRVSIDKLIISKGCKAFNQYVSPDTQSSVQTAKKLMALGYEFVPGMKVSWIVTNSKKTPIEVEPYMSGREFTHVPDWAYYAERMARSLSRITEVYSITEKDLLSGTLQTKLFEEDNAAYKIQRDENKLKLADLI